MKNLKRLTGILCVLAILLTLAPAGFAAGGPGSSDLEDIRSGIEYPKSDEYWEDYGYGVIRAPKGHSVYCYGSADRQGSQYTVPDGEEVIVLASRGEMFCVIIPSQNRARWVREKYVDLVLDGRAEDTWSGSVYRSGSPSAQDLEDIGSRIEYPKSGEYWYEYGYGVVNAPKGHSVYCYGSADRLGSQYTVLDGEEVVILASRGEMLCVIIPSQNRGRWIREKYVEQY